MVKNKKVYFILILLLALIAIIQTVEQNYMMIFLSALGIGLTVYQIRVNEDVKLVIIKNTINRRYKNRNLNNYFVVLLEITNLSTYSQFYDIKLSDYIIQQTYTLLKKKLHNNVFLYSGNQIVIINEFDNKTVINQLLRNNEQKDKTSRILNYIQSLKFGTDNNDEFYQAKVIAGTGSVGIRDENPTIEALISLAHFTLLHAKQSNKDFAIATEETRIIKDDIEIFNQEIEKGLEYDEFNPYFLPIIEPNSLKIIGCESLLRWEKNEYRIIEAAKFKSIAEEKHLFKKIDSEIITKSFSSYQKWLRKELINQDFILTINLSLQSLLEFKVHELIALAKKYNMNPKVIEFDISEHDILSIDALDGIAKLKDFGFKVSIDAFKSNKIFLKMLSDIKIDTIKLDRVNLPKEDLKQYDYYLYKNLIEFSKVMGYKVMSKGIENKSQLSIAQKLDVDYVQGYYFTPPLNDTRILGFLNKYQNGILV